MMMFLALAVATVFADGPREFDTPTQAAVYALSASYDLSSFYEYGGVITQLPDGKYGASFPQTDYHGDSVMIDEDYSDYSGGYPVVATYHSHPCLPDSHVPELFSPADVHLARSFMRPGYMLDECTGVVRVFDPVVDKDNGREVGHVSVSGVPVEKTDS
jgi:hypothetical protein